MHKTTLLASAAILLYSTPLAAVANNTMASMPMAGRLAVTASFNPAPPKQGTETILVTIKGANGKPVKGATVKIGANMPSMSMSGPTLTAHDNGDGTYSAKANINFATKWVFNITASAGGRKGSTRLSADIK